MSDYSTICQRLLELLWFVLLRKSWILLLRQFFIMGWRFRFFSIRFLLLPLYFTADFFRLFAFQSATILFVCGILIVFSTWLFARRKDDFKISAAITALYLVLIALLSSLCAIISSGIIDYFHYIYYDVPDMMNPIKSFTKSFVQHRFSLLASCILAQIPISFADRLIATFAGYGVYRLCEHHI